MRPLEFILTFAILFFLINAGISFFFPEKDPNEAPIELSMESTKVRTGNAPVAHITNNTNVDIALSEGRCPTPPFDVFYRAVDASEAQELIPDEAVLPCTPLTTLPAGQTVTVDLASWKYALFSRPGTYTLSLSPLLAQQSGSTVLSTVTTEFRVTEPGMFTKLFRTFITRPLFNALVFIASWMPGHNLGLAIIILTLLVKLALLLPNKHALEGQMRLQAVQPKMEELKKKYREDPKKLQEETMKLWKEMKVNPLQSCLPMLLQLPILIGLFFVIKDGVSIATSEHLLYSMYKALPANFLGYMFLGLDLLKPNAWLFAPLLVALQFVQMKMMMKKKKQKEIVVKPTLESRLQGMDQQTIMTYVLPIMIGVFAFQFPGAVSLYWAASTVFGIAQQWWIMRSKTVVSG